MYSGRVTTKKYPQLKSEVTKLVEVERVVSDRPSGVKFPFNNLFLNIFYHLDKQFLILPEDVLQPYSIFFVDQEAMSESRATVEFRPG